MLNIECNQEWPRDMELSLWSGQDIHYMYDEFVNMYGNEFSMSVGP